jgi:putative lumazine-binding protein
MKEFKDDHDAIRAVIQDYFEGVSGANTAPLERAWESSAGHWKGIETDVAGYETVKVEPIFDSIERWAKGPTKDASGEVLSLEVIDGQIAIVKFDFQLGNDRYLDILSLYKLNGEWKLINKMFVSR